MDMTTRLTLPLLNKRVGHWRPRYLWSRFRRWHYDSTHRGSPWLTRQAIALLEQLIAREDVGFEWGAGRSTLWFAQRCGRLWSVEHDPSWHSSVSVALQQARRDNVTLLLRERRHSQEAEYAGAVLQLPDESLDFVLVDGKDRDRCAVNAVAKLKPGGLLIIDNVERYLPSASRCPYARGPLDGYASETWRQFASLTHRWRRIWTSDGVTDTALFFKP